MENAGIPSSTDISPEQKVELDKAIDRIIQENKVNRKGARVFCVRCGNPGNRTPLRKWHKSYICENCFKILRSIGEEAFIEDLKGEKKGADTV